ncbi:hypothetical protein EXIGLDRAFT_244462 [Exidia glandulosa HHB12029]|uniref:SET domain-containing protein n=1 Tax=Exidia glandulosa HHB12029 TaxID=1314781 RepID=A0A166BQT6_EXIGL|nr:hypothetical protein EXIGLDRAFT_244462 [Exidia glandulosa HHB12029]
MELVAIRDIEYGEEVTISYLPLALCLEPSSRRQTWLKDEYGFICKCTSCSIPTISDPCRRFIAQAERDVAKSLAKLPDLKRAQVVELVEKILTILDRYEDDGLAPRVVQPHLSHTRSVAELYRWLDDATNEKVWRERATIEATAFDDDPHTTPALTDVLRPGSQSPVAFAVNNRRDCGEWDPAQREPRTSYSTASADQQSKQEESALHEHRPKRHRPRRQRSRHR